MPDSNLFLAGDIGGTNTRLALAAVQGDRVDILLRRHFANREADGLETLLSGFLAGQPAPAAACLAVAGPTDGRRARLTNLPWLIDADALASRLGLRRAALINDFVAVGHGLSALGDGELAVLQAGETLPDAPRVALGPGTGLGVVQCIPTAAGYRPLPSEGGHMAFAPMDALQDRLLAYLRRRHGRVSVERILSGPGLTDLYGFFRAESEMPGDPADDSPAAVSAAALAHRDGAAQAALESFCRILGQVAGDLALLAQARGGVYLAGGIALKILPALSGVAFLEGFTGKGRFSEWMSGVPVRVVLDEAVGLKGAALAASRLSALPGG
ncbi:MAG TPA: glucokinase [Thiobacillaceae bacterium]|nr:glucokinase [Thiobacillaceae bacterium]